MFLIFTRSRAYFFSSLHPVFKTISKVERESEKMTSEKKSLSYLSMIFPSDLVNSFSMNEITKLFSSPPND